MSCSLRLVAIFTGRPARRIKPRDLDHTASFPAAMSSEATAELADLVHEWLRIDQVRVDKHANMMVRL